MMFECLGVANVNANRYIFEFKYRYKDSRIDRFFNFNVLFS